MGQLKYHEASLVGMAFSSVDPNLFWTCGQVHSLCVCSCGYLAQDRRVVMWDVQAQAPAKVFQLGMHIACPMRHRRLGFIEWL